MNSVSGDYCSIITVSDTAVGIFMCDVMGRGVRAALVSAMISTLQEQLKHLVGNPGAMLTQMNRSLRSILGRLNNTLFTTACYVVVDVDKGRLTIANAGHPCPLILREATAEVEAIENRNPALGLFDEVEYFNHELSVAAGDQVFVFTDGLFNVTNAKSESFGTNRLRDSIHRRAGLPLTKLTQDVFSEIETFAAGQAYSDDICLIGLEVSHLMKDMEERQQQLDKCSSPAMVMIG